MYKHVTYWYMSPHNASTHSITMLYSNVPTVTYYFKRCAIIKSFGSYLLDGVAYDTHTLKLTIV